MKKIAMIMIIVMLVLVSVNAYAEDPTPEQILQKVADNNNKINDSKITKSIVTFADTIKLSEIAKDICYYKKENKVRSEIFKENMVDLEQVIIFNDKNMVILDGSSNIISQSTAKEESLPPSDFDFLNDMAKFIANFSVSLILGESDPLNNLYALLVIPKISNEKYAKLKYYIDYNKGYLYKIRVFNALNEEIMTIEESNITKYTDSLGKEIYYAKNKVSAGVVKGSETNGIPIGKTYNIVVNTGIQDIEINKGLPDSLFTIPDK